MKNIFLKNTLIILITSLLIKLLGLLNKIILTRSLGEQGIGLYSLILPTIMLFISLSCFSLNIAMITVTAKNKSKKIIKTGIILGLITTSISSIILLLILNKLSFDLLKQPDTYYPIIYSIPLFYLTTISSILRGYLTGIEKMSTTSIANLLEQIARIIFTIIIFVFIKDENLVTYVIYAIIAMSVGELCSIIYSIINIRKINYDNPINNNKISSDLLQIAIPSTLTSLISNLTFFLEPIIFTFILNKLLFNSNDILLKYSEVTVYSLPLITLFSFVSMSISTVIMPKISTSNDNTIKEYINKLIILCLLPAILVSTVLFNYCEEITLLLYNTKIGTTIVKKYVWYFMPFYLISPFNTILLSTNQSKKAFLVSLIVHLVKLISLFILPIITNDALIISYLITYLLTFILIFIILLRKYKFKIPFNHLITLLVFAIVINCFSIIIKQLNIHYIIQIMIISLFFILIIFPFIKRNYI